ncbi:hypothetical protein R6Q59_010145 [Mikania micrantha]
MRYFVQHQLFSSTLRILNDSQFQILHPKSALNLSFKIADITKPFSKQHRMISCTSCELEARITTSIELSGIFPVAALFQQLISQGMLSGRWQYSRCLGQLARTVARVTRLPQEHELLSTSLIERARSMRAEHAKLFAANAENFDTATAKKIGELTPVTEALREWEDAQNTDNRKSIRELEALVSDPTSDKELRELASSDIEEAVSNLPSLTDKLKSSLIPAHPFAHLPALLEIHPGAGGSEASLFAHTLLEMYTALASRLNLPTSLTSYTPDDSIPAGNTGMTDCILEINSANAYDLFRTEAGVHRVQRVPATEKKGRTHTSAVSVLVLPSIPETNSAELNFEDPNSDYYINPGDVRSETMRARGAGGQHVNKTDSAIRLTHMPTGTVVAMQESRSQHKNREKAWQVLRSKLAQMRREARENEMVALRRSVMGGVARTGREDKVRTYNYSQQRVTDHRSGVESGDLNGVVDGGPGLEKIMDSVRDWMRENEAMSVVAEEEMKKREGEKVKS